jgi:hypothetical protein
MDARRTSRAGQVTSASEGVATVDDSGRLKTTGTASHRDHALDQNKVLYVRVAVPYPNEVSPADYSKFQPANFIDEQMLDKWKSLKLVPSPRSTDAQFLRRVYLDAAGILPTPEEVEEFLGDASPDKRSKAIAKLLDRDEFADYWAYKWSDLLLVS